MKIARSTLSEDLLRAFGCGTLGIAAPAFVLSIPSALTLFPILFFFGIMLGLPAIAVVLILVVSARANIHRYLRTWCCAAPFLTVIVTAIFAQAVLVGDSWFNERGYQAFRHLDMIFLLVPMFFGAVVSAGLFYHWTRQAEQRAGVPLSLIHI